MGATRHKLDEARFFLKQLESHYLKRPEGDYFLSAFVISARSVLWVMKHEYHDVSGWQAWYDAIQPTGEENRFLRGINEARVRSEKKEALQTTGQIRIRVPPEHWSPELQAALEDLKGRKLHVVFTDETDPQGVEIGDKSLTMPARLDSVYRVLEEFPGEDVLLVCKGYASWLQNLVRECERRFGAVELEDRSNP